METFNIHEAKTHLSKLVDQAAKGEHIVIARHGKPIALLTAYPAPSELPPRQPGAMRGQIWIAPDFDDPDPEIERMFYGSDVPGSSGQK
jgi:prevent-host-death family protein